MAKVSKEFLTAIELYLTPEMHPIVLRACRGDQAAGAKTGLQSQLAE